MKLKTGKRRIGTTQEKILLVLLTGVALGFTQSPRTYFKIIDAFKNDWKAISEQKIKRSVTPLRHRGYVRYVHRKDGTHRVELTQKGREKAQEVRISELQVKKPGVWDGRWRLVLFDIPRSKNKKRDVFRFHLKRLGFLELQQSVFVYPFECWEILEDIIAFYNIQSHVVVAEAVFISNENVFRKKFDI